MTTIAYKDGILAADTQLTIDKHIRATSSPKIKVLNEDTIIACSGDTNEIYKMEMFFREKEWDFEKAPKFKKAVEALLFHRGQGYICFQSCLPEPLCDNHYALGSGYQFALAAMKIGLAAPEAVKFASSLDVFTNDILQVLNVQQFFQEKEAKRAGRGTRRKVVQEA